MRPVNRAVKLTVLPVLGAAAVALSLTTGGSAAGAASKQIIPEFPHGSAVVQHKVERVPNTTGIRGVHAYDTKGYPAPGRTTAGTLEHQHVHTRVKYSVVPPVGGPHNEKWMNAGTYTKPVPSERAVHNLEHGAVWITYKPGLSKTKLRNLYKFVHRQTFLAEGRQEKGGPVQGNRFIDLSPWTSDSLGAPIVISSWGYQLKVTKAKDKRLQQFVDRFRRAEKYAPESDAPVDGLSSARSGVPARDGSLYPNPR